MVCWDVCGFMFCVGVLGSGLSFLVVIYGLFLVVYCLVGLLCGG